MPSTPRNWRRSYHLRMQDHFEEFLDEYARGSWRPVELPSGLVKAVRDLTHRERVDLAWREAERDIHRAMIMARESEAEERLALGEAI